MDTPKYSVHLFAGGGGGLMSDCIDGTVPICAVEISEYQQKILRARFPILPVWDDVRTFTRENDECSRMFDAMSEIADDLIVCGGFPCQDISCAGKGEGIFGERSGLWQEFARIVGEVRPRFVFLENSPFIVHRGLGKVLGDLSSLRYDGAWGILSASVMGCRHIRERFWGMFKRAD